MSAAPPPDSPDSREPAGDGARARGWPRLYPFTRRLRLPRGADDGADERARDSLVRGFAAHVGVWVSVVVLVLLVLAIRACAAG